jgi:hypothetical protein
MNDIWKKIVVALIVILAIVAAIFVVLYFLARDTFWSLIRLLTGKAPYWVHGTGRIIYGTEVNFPTTPTEREWTEQLPVNHYAGFKCYQKAGVAIPTDKISALLKVTKEQLVNSVEAMGLKVDYMRISWNYASDNLIRDMDICLVFKPTGSVTPESVYSTLTSNVDVQAVIEGIDFDCQAYGC